jgi:hypothetical protein
MSYRLWLSAYGLLIAASVAPPHAQTPQITFTATLAHGGQPGSPVKINLFRWSTDEERSAVVGALNAAPPAPPAAATPTAEPATPPTSPDGERGGGARAGRAGREGGSGALAATIGKSPTIGYLWTDEVTGYAIKYAFRALSRNGGQRIILATNRALGAQSPLSKPVGSAPATEYEFTVIELRLNSKGLGEGKTSLTSNVIVDNEAKSIALENYAAAPVMLKVRQK